jgi:hypothetical protein
MKIKTHTRYSITAIKQDGVRGLAFTNNYRRNYLTIKEAEEMLSSILKNNSEEKIHEHIGRDLQVTKIQCYPGGDSIRSIF